MQGTQANKNLTCKKHLKELKKEQKKYKNCTFCLHYYFYFCGKFEQQPPHKIFNNGCKSFERVVVFF